MINYSTLISEFNSAIEGYSGVDFRHIPRHQWVDEEGKLAQAKINNAFSTLIVSKSDDEDYFENESAIHKPLLLDVQFALDFKHDNYLSVLGHCEVAVKEAFAATYTAAVKISYDPEFELVPEGNFIRVYFTGLKLFIKTE